MVIKDLKISQQGNLIRIKNQGEIDERYLGAPFNLSK